MLSIIWITIAIYLFFTLVGWGAMRLILRDGTPRYQFWLAPWLGLIVSNISLMWLSRLGLGTNRSVYFVILLGIGLLGLCKLLKIPLLVRLRQFDGIIALGSFLALFLALYPMILKEQIPTTISLVNADPAFYVVVADFLKSHSIRQPPLIDPEHPSTKLIRGFLSPGNRPGVFLVLGLLASLLNVSAYKIFTITLGVFFALTPPLISIFTWVITKRYFPAVLTLILSVFNVNILYFSYNGFAAQILHQGCMILAFMWFYLAERGDKPYSYYLIPLGLSISSMFTFFPEGSIFFIGILVIYVVLRFLKKKSRNLKFVKNLALVAALTVAINPPGIPDGIKFALAVSGVEAGWPMPRWAFPVDMVGFLSIYSSQAYPNSVLVFLSLPVLGLIGLGLNRSGNRTLGLSCLTFMLVFLVWLGPIRKFSYGYHKSIAFMMFAILIAFSVGLASIIARYGSRLGERRLQASALCIVVLLSATSASSTFQTMLSDHKSVTHDLINLIEVSKIAKERKVYLNEPRIWEQMWATNFLGKTRIAFMDPNLYYGYEIFPVVEEGGLLLTPTNTEDIIIRESTKSTDKLLWKNALYSLFTPSEKGASIQLGKNWWNIEGWWGERSDSKVFRWMNQDAIINIKNKISQSVVAMLKIKFVPILPKTTVDVYLNERLIETFKIEGKPQFYPISFNVEKGDSQIRFHVREGIIQFPGDSRKFALGANAIRFDYY